MKNAIIVENGRVIDPEKGEIEKRAIGIIDGKFADVEKVRRFGDDVKTIDAQNMYVAPGFIDLHVHVFNKFATIGIDADTVGIRQGVTTIIDAGSSGYGNYSIFKKEVIEKSTTEVLAFLNISKNGLVGGLSELADPEEIMKADEALEIFKREKHLVGLKARMSKSVVKDQGVAPLRHARQLADLLDVPIMVHIGNPPPFLSEILPLLKEGDIVTHAFHGKKHGMIRDGILIPEAEEAIRRGVLFDVGHGTSSFSFQTLQQYKERYKHPFLISTDIYSTNYEKPVGSLMTTMTKLLTMGYSLMEVVQSVTTRAAQALGLNDHGTFRPGTIADVTIFSVNEGPVELVDSEGDRRIGTHFLQPEVTVKSGKVVYLR